MNNPFPVAASSCAELMPAVRLSKPGESRGTHENSVLSVHCCRVVAENTKTLEKICQKKQKNKKEAVNKSNIIRQIEDIAPLSQCGDASLDQCDY